MCESFYHWENDTETSFRKLVLHIDRDIEKERNKFINWNGDYKKCSKCKESLPACTYFFISGGKQGLHRYCKKCESGRNYGWGIVYNNELNKHGFHYCSKCDRILPLNPLYFNRTNGRCNKTGYSSNCKECIGKEDGFGMSQINNKNNIFDIRDGYKICSTCHIELPNNDDYFFKKKERKNGMCICKKCKGFEYGVYRGNVVYKEIMPESHKFCNVCKQFVLNSDFNFGAKCCDNCAKKKRKIYNSKPETKHRLRMFSQKRRAKKKKLKHDLTKEQYDNTLIFFDNSCAYCGITEGESVKLYDCKLHQEHIIPLSNGGGYTKNNIIPACKSCNTSKNTKSLDEFYEDRESFTEEKYFRILRFVELHTNIKDKIN